MPAYPLLADIVVVMACELRDVRWLPVVPRPVLPLAPLGAAALMLTETRYCTEHLHRTRSRYRWRWATNQFAEAAQVLGDGGERELELGAAWTSQSESAESQNALQVCEQHFDLLAITTGLGKRLGPGEGTRNIAGVFVHIAWHFALW